MAEVRMTPLVRKYSLQLTDPSVLSKSLKVVAKVEEEDEEKQKLELQEWQKWIRFEETSSDPGFERLMHYSKLLAESWRTFGSLFDVEVTNCILGHSVPTIDTLLHAVDDANSTWESNKQTPMGRAKERFLRFTNTLNDYSFLFSVIPNNDKYTSLITGVISSIAKAARKYQETAERISNALNSITYDILLVQKRTRIAGTSEVCGFVMEFFVKIFELLCFIMSWYKSRAKRVLGSLTKSFDKDLNEKVDAVQQVLKKLSEEANLITQLRVYDTQESVAQISSTVENTSKDIQQVKALLENFVVQIGLLDVGRVATQQMNSIDQGFVRRMAVTNAGRMFRQASPTIDGTHSSSSTSPFGVRESNRIVTRFTKSDLLQYSQQLKQFLDDRRDMIPKDGRPMARALLPSEVVREMQKWMASASSKMLWVEGVNSHDSGPILSTAALHICSIATNAGIPCVSYFCTTPREQKKAAQKDPSLTHTEATCVSLLYSIIIQLCENLPYDLVEIEELDHLFQLLDGSLRSSEVAIGLIEELFAYQPPLTVWVLDRLPFVRTKSTVPYIEKLIQILRREDEGRVTKVLYTTEGNTHWLAGNLQVGERFSASRMALNKPGHSMPGAVSPLFHGNF